MKNNLGSNKNLILFVLLVTLGAVSLPAQENPFLSSPGGEAAEPGASSADTAPLGGSSPELQSSGDQDGAAETVAASAQSSGTPRRSRFLRFISSIQKQLYHWMAEGMKSVKESKNQLSTLFLVLAGSLLYGMLHALGPGHRKTVLFSYFMAENAPLWKGMAAGALMALLHGGAAVAIILPIYYLLKGSLLVTFNSVSRSIEIGTFLFIAIFGLVMLSIEIIGLLRHRHAEKSDRKAPGHERRMLLLIIGSGLVPCPGAAMVLLFALSMQMVGLGLMAVAAMSVGMAITLSLVALITLGARKSIERAGARHERALDFIHHGLELGAYLLITVFGLVMAWGLL